MSDDPTLRIKGRDIRIGIQPGTRALRLDRYPDEGCWHVWINANFNFTRGTYLALYDDGRIDRVTMRSGEGDEVLPVKPSDKEC